MVVVVIVISVPVLVVVPLVCFSIPPLMIAVPAGLTLRDEVMPPCFGFMAVVTVSSDRVIEPRFGFLNAMLAFAPFIVGTRSRCCEEHKERNDAKGSDRRAA